MYRLRWQLTPDLPVNSASVELYGRYTKKNERWEYEGARGEDKESGMVETTSFAAFPSPLHCKLNFVILLPMWHQFWHLDGKEMWTFHSPSSVFPKDHRDRVLSVTCDHPGLKCSESSLAMNVKVTDLGTPAPSVHMKPKWPPVPGSARSWLSFEKIGDCEQFTRNAEHSFCSRKQHDYEEKAN